MAIFDCVGRNGLFICPKCLTKQRHMWGKILEGASCIKCGFSKLVDTRNGRIKGDELQVLMDKYKPKIKKVEE